MPIDLTDAIRSIVAAEVEAALAPHTEALSRLSGFLGGPLIQTGSAPPRIQGAPIRATRVIGRVRSTGKVCSVSGCSRDAKSLGFCASHYLKFRNLTKTKRLPSDWVAHAEPGTIQDIVLPRGRAAAKILRRK